MFEWWDASGASQAYREHIAKQLGFEAASDEGDDQYQDDGQEQQHQQQQHQARRPARDQSQQSQEPRQVFRPPQPARRNPPSLNSARGGQRNGADPRTLDGSEQSIFDYATGAE